MGGMFGGRMRKFGVVLGWAVAVAWVSACDPVSGGGGGLGGRMAVIRDGSLHVSDSDGSLDQTLTESNSSSSPAITGSTVAFFYEPTVAGSGRGLYLATTAGGTPTLLLAAPEGVSFESPAWTPDGASVTFVRREGAARTVQQVSRTGGEPTDVATGGVEAKYVAHVSATELVVVDATSGEISTVTGGVATPLSRHTTSRVAVSPDGASIAFSDADAADQLKVLALATQEVTALPVQSTATAQPCYSPDGRYVAFQVTSTGDLVYALPADGTDTLEGPLVSGSDVAWGN